MLSRLDCGYQQYDWGKLGSDSRVARFAATNADVHIDPAQPYAELWMGTHPKVPARLVPSGENLRDVLTQRPALLGTHVVAEFGGGELPFLFKVLSIRKALSIQAHPDKALAKQLHARDPKNYPDDNHKPEMAVALTSFEGFCGFRPVNEIAWFLDHVPEFAELVGEAAAAEFKQHLHTAPHSALHVLFGAVMAASELKIQQLAPRLAERAQREGANFAERAPFGGKVLAELLVRVNAEFPQDVGLFCGGLMLNYVTLRPGEAMFLAAKVPHAYISGDIVECMAASDNVVRAGFTPKFKDVTTLVDMLTYDSGSAEDQKMVPTADALVLGGETKRFNPPISEFFLLVHSASAPSVFRARPGPSIYIIVEGSGSVKRGDQVEKYEPGFVFFAGADTEFELVPSTPTVSYHAVAE